MKRTFLAMIMLGGSCALFAQTTGTNTGTNNGTNTGSTTNTSTNTNTSVNGNTNNWNTTTNSSLNNSSNTGYYGSYYGNYGTTGSTGMNTTTGMNGTTNLNSTGSYGAYGTAASVNVPLNVQSSFQANYPLAAGTTVTWQQANPDWWRAAYGASGQYNNVMYNQAGQSFIVAVPVLQTYVPQEVVDKAYQMHGINLYDITEMRSSIANNYYSQNSLSTANAGTASISPTYYMVRYFDNGMLQAEKINADGTAFMDTNMNNQLNSTSSNAAMDNSSSTEWSDSSHHPSATMSSTTTTTTTTTTDQTMSGGKTKVKTKDANGQGSKTKYKNGEMIKNKQYKGKTTNGTNDTNGGGF
jgi:hypothetical protein